MNTKENSPKNTKQANKSIDTKSPEKRKNTTLNKIYESSNSKDFLDGDVVDGNNQVVIYDFSTEKYSLYLNEGLINNDVRTITEGRSQILPNGDLFIEESNYGRTLFFNNNGDLQWTHVNRGVNGNIGRVSWSRILYSERDLRNVKNFLDSKKNCSND